ncbi:MAG: type II toxin-antitoxin system VapC family toxin [Deltaproteobacteria bacterium]|nr:type II toxin-antitoxin system VapC family toxin [Deltaproteobacteria bacterium]
MRYLLDTHTFLWMRHSPSRLGERARAVASDVDSALLLSDVSVWEMAIKLSIGKLKLMEPLAQIVREAHEKNGIERLPIEQAHILRVEQLPLHHRDPFDRLLAAQALIEGLTVSSRDRSFDRYGVKRIW